MKIVILGGGLAGCVSAYLLREEGHDVVIIEENDHVGGTCQTHEFGGIRHEFGPHLLYGGGKERDFFEKFLTNNEYIIYPKVCLNDDPTDLYAFPLSYETIEQLPHDVKEKVYAELKMINPDMPDYANFEKYMLSRLGKTLYQLFVENYNRKQWGIEPSALDITWAKFRPFSISEKTKGRFGDKWQGHPGDYRPFFKQLIEGSHLERGTVTRMDVEHNKASGVFFKRNGMEERVDADFVLSTLPLDLALGKEKKLTYRNTHKVYALLDCEAALSTMWMTFPNVHEFLRIFEYKKQSKQTHDHTLLSFSYQDSQKTTDVSLYVDEINNFIKTKLQKKILDTKNVHWERTYPLPTLENEEFFVSLLKESCGVDNFASLGRQGLFSYISMDTCVKQCMKIAENINLFVTGEAQDRYDLYASVRQIMS